MININRFWQISLVVTLGLTQFACENASTTVQNPNLNIGTSGYSGPPAATDDVRAFELSVWNNLKAENRCGQCHGDGQSPTFVDLADVNAAYSEAVPLINQQDPGNSRLVTKVGSGHNCWLTSDVACADSIEQMVIAWSGASAIAVARLIQLTPPEIKDPGDSKTFPVLATDNAPNSFELTVHPLLVMHCQSCHEETALLPISPFFANADPATAYEAAKSKMNIDDPGKSRFVLRLDEEFHNCWTNSCTDDATTMQTAISDFAINIVPTSVDPNLVASKALTLLDGIVAAGGNRHESNLIAIWEFKTRGGSTAFDTSGIEPAVNLNMSGSFGWLGSYGIDLTGGKAQADTANSKKIHDFIRSSGEFSIEAWAIPSNVTQEDANIVSYSAGATSRNFTLGQDMYNYVFYNRTTPADDPNGEPLISTPDADEILQSSLQHVVATYDPIAGRSLYVNGNLIAVTDPDVGSTGISNWDDSYAFVLGNEVSNNRTWNGKLRMVAIHNRVLTPAQVDQNFEVGVGEKYFLLFSIADQIGTPGSGIPDSYIMFEVSQFDSYGYLFENPVFINLDPDWVPVPVEIEGMRIGINGREAFAGQAFANLDVDIQAGLYSAQTGQSLSTLGAVISLEKGSASDEFFLTFEKLDSNIHAFNDPAPGIATAPPDADPVSDIGVKTFEEINATISAMTGIPVTNAAVDAIYDQYRQQLPTVEMIDAFLPSHQMAVAQLALTSCSELVDNNKAYFAGFDFGATAFNAFDDATKRALVMDPLLEAALNIDAITASNNLTSQPVATVISDMLVAPTTQDLDGLAATSDDYESLISTMTACDPDPDINDPPCVLNNLNTTLRTEQIVKALCAAVVGGATMIVQ